MAGHSQTFDRNLLISIFSVRCEALTIVFRAITFLGNTNTVIIICAVLVIIPGRMKIGLPVSLMVIVGWLLQTVLKTFAARPRPDIENWLISLSENEYFQSFPSGHSNVSMILWVSLAVLIGRLLIAKNKLSAARLLRVVFFIIAFMIGFSRLYLGVHYPTDVFGGWLLAGTILIICLILYDLFWPEKWRVSK
jgi:undecaprenyl-diphosphatase